jgi:hypothetical protein
MPFVLSHQSRGMVGLLDGLGLAIGGDVAAHGLAEAV